jgi:hypothetical protein
VDSTIEQASAAVDTKMKEADKFVDEKREQVQQVVKDTTQKAAETKDEASASILGKAKGVLNCKYGLVILCSVNPLFDHSSVSTGVVKGALCFFCIYCLL